MVCSPYFRARPMPTLFGRFTWEVWPRAVQPFRKLAISTAADRILAVVNFLGYVPAARQYFVTIAKLASLGLVAVAGAVYLMTSHPMVPDAVLSPRPMTGTSHRPAIFAYGGSRPPLIAAGEARNPRLDMPFGLFARPRHLYRHYGLIQWVVVGVLPDPGHSRAL